MLFRSSPVREALNRLETEGLVCIELRRGAYVREFSMEEVSDLYAFREVLELHSIAASKSGRSSLSSAGKSQRPRSSMPTAGWYEQPS